MGRFIAGLMHSFFIGRMLNTFLNPPSLSSNESFRAWLHLFCQPTQSTEKSRKRGPLNSNFVSTKIDWREVSQVFAVEGILPIFISRWRFSFGGRSSSSGAEVVLSWTPVGYLQGVAGFLRSAATNDFNFLHISKQALGVEWFRPKDQTPKTLVMQF